MIPAVYFCKPHPHLDEVTPNWKVVVTAAGVKGVENNSGRACQYATNATILVVYLWPPYVIGGAFIFLPCSFFLSSSFFSSPNLSGHRLDVYHISTHGVALVRI